jgi:hypothetical protein
LSHYDDSDQKLQSRFALSKMYTGPVLAECGKVPGAKKAPQEEIDQRSYRLGSIAAFAEVVGAGIKQLAISAAMPARELDALEGAATEVAAGHGCTVWRERAFLVTDLFPSSVTDGLEVLLITKEASTTVEQWKTLKAKKAERIAAGKYSRGRVCH